MFTYALRFSRLNVYFFFTLNFHFLAVTAAVTFFFSSALAFLLAAFSYFFLISSSLRSFLAIFFFLYRDEVLISYATACLHFVITLDCLGCIWMDCGVIILWLPAELEDVHSADMNERGLWSMCGDMLGWISLHYYNLLRLFVHIWGSILR